MPGAIHPGPKVDIARDGLNNGIAGSYIWIHLCFQLPTLAEPSCSGTAQQVCGDFLKTCPNHLIEAASQLVLCGSVGLRRHRPLFFCPGMAGTMEVHFYAGRMLRSARLTLPLTVISLPAVSLGMTPSGSVCTWTQAWKKTGHACPCLELARKLTSRRTSARWSCLWRWRR